MGVSQFLDKEDEALRNLLNGAVTVADSSSSARPVRVYYGLPDKEKVDINGTSGYPFITLDLVNMSPDPERTRSGPFFPDPDSTYAPEDWPVATALTSLYGELPPTPYNLDYQITTWARHPRHDRQILRTLLSGPLPYQFGQVSVVVDNSERRLVLVNVLKRDTLDSNGKRIYRNVFSVRMSAELAVWQVQLATQVTEVVVTGPTDTTDYSPVDFTVTPPTP